MNTKIISLEAENIKRIKAVRIEFKEDGLTVIGGKNGQGKTSTLDAIAYALGGAKFQPSEPIRDGSHVPPRIEVKLNNGLVVTRSGAKGNLKVVDPSGQKAGQTLLSSLIGQFALDLPLFMNMSDKERANQLLQLLGIGDELTQIEREYQRLYAERREIGRTADAKNKHAQEMEVFDGVPDEPISAMELIKEQQDILARNGENQQKRRKKDMLEGQHALLIQKVETARIELEKLEKELHAVSDDLVIANMDIEDLVDGSTAELEERINDIDEINQKVRANQKRMEALIEAGEYQGRYAEYSDQLKALQERKQQLLESKPLPLSGLGISDGALTYMGKKWDCMSGSEQLKVSAAIAQALSPDCGFILVDKLEQMDVESMHEFGEWATAQGLQIIATRVTSNPDECSLIIEDGEVAEEPVKDVKKDWGGF